jgi:hypothetical protein
MLTKIQNFSSDELETLLNQALTNEGGALDLESYVMQYGFISDLGRPNLALLEAFAGLVAGIVSTSNNDTLASERITKLEKLLDRWAAVDTTRLNSDDVMMVFPNLAAISYAYVAAARPDWWNDELTKLHLLALSSSLQIREVIVAGLRFLEQSAPEHLATELQAWQPEGELSGPGAIANSILTSSNNS